MNKSEQSSQSFDHDHFIMKNMSKASDNSTQQSVPRSRFTILSDITQSSKQNQKEEELLSKYLRDLHQEQQKSQKEELLNLNKQQIPNFQMKLVPQVKKCQVQEQIQVKQPKQIKLKSKKDTYAYMQKNENVNKENIRQNKEVSRNGQKQGIKNPRMQFFQGIGIMTYKKRINLAQSLEQIMNWQKEYPRKENMHKNYEYSNKFKNGSSKDHQEPGMLFTEALHKQTPKYYKF